MDKREAVIKTANLAPVEVTDSDIEKINAYTLAPVNSEDVFIFKATIADNEGDDRNCMPFNMAALEDLKNLYPGTTMLKDHDRAADNQIARVFDCEIVTHPNKMTEFGEVYAELIAKMYMIRTDSNKDLIAEIVGGIKKEVSTSTMPKKMVCNICGADNMQDYCKHWPGEEYDGKTCKMILDGAVEAYELSFVAVPAQPRAGTHKAEAGPDVDHLEDKTAEEADKKNSISDSETLALRVKVAESFLFVSEV